MSASTAAKAIPCQFFMIGTCQHDGKTCQFSHDPDVCRPGAIKQQCAHYQGGYCRNGNFCLHQHDRDARDQALKAKHDPNAARKTVVAHKPVVSMSRTSFATPFNGLQATVQPPAPQSRPGPNLETLRPSWSPQGHASPTSPSGHRTSDGPDAQAQSQAAFHAALQHQDDQMYFYGTLPAEGAAAPGRAALAPDWSRLAQEVAQQGPTPEQIEFAQRQAAMQAQLHVAQGKTGRSKPPCRFFLQGSCRFGQDCRFSHAAPAFDPELDLTSFERSASKDLDCGICLEVIMDTPDGRFGLLTGCDHAFCLKCIKNWRSSDMSHKEDSKELVRRCPLCRQPSYFVVPCDRMVRDPARKEAIVEEYRAAMKKIHCSHFDHGNGTCPFGTSCFYRHVYPDGREQDPGELRTYKDAEGKTKVDSTSRLGTYFDQALRVSAPRQPRS